MFFSFEWNFPKGALLNLRKKLLMFIAFFAPVNAASGESINFQEIHDSHWAKAQIMDAVEKGYVSGFPDGTFRPDEPVSRAQFIRMLVDALDLPHVQQGNPWYQPYVAAVLETGIHRAQDFDGTYDHPMSRLEMIRLAVRAIHAETEWFTDAEFVAYSAEKGILHGDPDGNLKLEGYATRAESVVVIERILELRRGLEIPVNEKAISNAKEWREN